MPVQKFNEDHSRAFIAGTLNVNCRLLMSGSQRIHLMASMDLH